MVSGYSENFSDKTNHFLPDESIKRPVFEKILLPEYQSSDVKNRLAFSRYVQLGPVICPALIGHILRNVPFRKPAKTNENDLQTSPLISFLALVTLIYIHVFCPLGRMESP